MFGFLIYTLINGFKPCIDLYSQPFGEVNNKVRRMLDDHIQNDYGTEPIDSIDITITDDELDLLPLSDDLHLYSDSDDDGNMVNDNVKKKNQNPKTWEELPNYQEYLTKEIIWCIDRTIQVYKSELINNIGEETRSEILWLSSFVVNILDDILPETADHIKTKIKELLDSRSENDNIQINCEHLYAMTAYNLGEDINHNKLVSICDRKQIIEETDLDHNTPRSAMITFMHQGIISQAYKLNGYNSAVNMKWISERYGISVKQYMEDKYKFPRSVLVSKVRAQNAYFLMHYPILVLNMGKGALGNIDINFIQPILNGWFDFLTSRKSYWTNNFELLAEVILSIIICKRHTDGYELPNNFESGIFLIQQSITLKYNGRRNAKIGNLSVYFFKENRNSGTKRHQSYHTNILVALVMSNYIAWKNESVNRN